MTTTVHVRIDQDVEARAADTLAKMGLTVSDAVQLFLNRVANENALPFQVGAPNAETVAAMQAGDRGEVSRAASVAEMMILLHAND